MKQRVETYNLGHGLKLIVVSYDANPLKTYSIYDATNDDTLWILRDSDSNKSLEYFAGNPKPQSVTEHNV